ncbi:baseplate J/gp47 family protein [Vibrio parahaemolyticus]|uniref:baseplate J/gp47 family protein n=1 Tax=Vibrio parahaemolyticus TaxID=670 RepID=UPI003891D49D
MAHKQPEISELQARILTDIEGKIGQKTPLLKKAAWRVLSWALAGVISILYKYINYRSLQMFVQTADEDGLTLWGDTYDVPRGKESAAKFNIVLVGTDGQVVKAGTQYTKNTTGYFYRQLETVTLSGGEAVATVVATQGGVTGNLSVGDFVSPVNPIGIEKQASIVEILVTGTDAEEVEVWRSRILERIRNPPQGGALADYVQWAEEPTGIKRAFVEQIEAGTVGVYCESSTEADGIPTETQLQEAEDSIRSAYRLPMTAALSVLPISRLTFDISVVDLQPNEGDMHTAIEGSLELFMKQREPFMQGLSMLPKKNEVSVNLLLSQVVFSINAYGGTFKEIKLYSGGTEITTKTLAIGELAKLGAVNYTSSS